MSATAATDVDCDVLVVGLGPVGALLANLLGRAGASVIAVDEAAGTYELPRAAVVDDEVLRIFQSVGLDERIAGDAQVQRTVTYVTDGGVAVDIMRPVSGPYGHPPLVSIHQPSIERALLAGLERYPHVQPRWSTRLEAIDPARDHVDAWVRPSGGGRRVRLRARWLVGCDGGGSGVRRRIGASFGGSTFAQRWIVLDALVERPLPAAPHPHFVGRPDRPTVCLPMSPGRHRWEFMLHPGEDAAPLLRPENLRALMAPWTAGTEPEIERTVVYTFHARTASRWRRGRVLLAGDAAHVMPPFVGQGFSSGARDAGNLAWKLVEVLRGAPETLLDTYEEERRPHVRKMQRLAVRWGGILQTTDRRVAGVRDRVLPALDRVGVMGWVRENAKPLATYPAGAFAQRPARIPLRRAVGGLFPQPAVRDRATGERVALDARLGDGWCVVARDGAAAVAAEALGEAVVALGRDLDDVEGVVARWLDRHGAAWALLRPDRFVFACGGPDDVDGARRALDATRAPRPSGTSTGADRTAVAA